MVYKALILILKKMHKKKERIFLGGNVSVLQSNGIYLRLQGLDFLLQLFDFLIFLLRLGLGLLPRAELFIKLQGYRQEAFACAHNRCL